MNQNECPYCTTEIINIKKPFHSLHLEHGIKVSQLGYEGYCRECNIPFKRFIKTKFNDTGWFSTTVRFEMITEELSSIQSNFITIKLGKYKIKSEKWEKFVSYTRQDDKLFLFENMVDKDFGIVMTRSDKPILSFPLSEYLFKLVKET